MAGGSGFERYADEERLRESPATRDTGSERFTDEEAAILRKLRFGSLPPPLNPEDLVATVETDLPPEEPWQPVDPQTFGG